MTSDIELRSQLHVPYTVMKPILVASSQTVSSSENKTLQTAKQIWTKYLQRLAYVRECGQGKAACVLSVAAAMVHGNNACYCVDCIVQ